MKVLNNLPLALAQSGSDYRCNNIYKSNNNLYAGQADMFTKSDKVSFHGIEFDSGEITKVAKAIKRSILHEEPFDIKTHMKDDNSFKRFFVAMDEVLGDYCFNLSNATNKGDSAAIEEAKNILRKTVTFWKKIDNSETNPQFVQRFLALRNSNDEDEVELVHEVLRKIQIAYYC